MYVLNVTLYMSAFNLALKDIISIENGDSRKVKKSWVSCAILTTIY